MDINKEIKKRRLAKGLTQTALGLELSVSPQQICNIESGRAKLSAKHWSLIQKKLGISQVDMVKAHIKDCRRKLTK